MKQLSTVLFCFAAINVGFAQCKELRKSIDKFQSTVTVNMPAMSGTQLEPLRIVRVDKKDLSFYYLRLAISVSSPKIGTGVYVLFSDGSKLEWPVEEVDVRYGSGYWAYSMVPLAENELKEFTEKRVTDIKLHTYQRALKAKQSERVRSLINCLVSIDPATVKSGND